MSNIRAGTIYFKIDGIQYDAKGDFTYNLGGGTRGTIVGSDQSHGYKITPRPAHIEGKITDAANLDVAKLQSLDGVTVTLELANGKTVVFKDAWFAGEGNINTGEAEIDVRFESRFPAEEVQ